MATFEVDVPKINPALCQVALSSAVTSILQAAKEMAAARNTFDLIPKEVNHHTAVFPPSE